MVATQCAADYVEEWDLDELLRQAQTYFPTRATREQLNDLHKTEEIYELLHDDALELYGAKEESIGTDTLREIERRVMLSVIDQHWREHLYEMDYLREGINLRAMGQKDPLAEWQREGYDMFEAMVGGIQDDFVRYVFHLQVVAEEQPPRAPEQLKYSAPEGPVQGASGLRATAAATPPEELMGPTGGGTTTAVAEAPEVVAPVRVEKTPGRNEPCWCGSGKKFKLCHGR